MMNTQYDKMNGSAMEAQVIIRDFRAEINLEGSELLKFEPGQPTRVLCTTGTLWLTQPGDPHDHLLKAGQSFSLDQPGMVLVQGLPCGKVRILDILKEPLYTKRDCPPVALREGAFQGDQPPI
jgi:hypothetical protein